jgi:hypothetical protein
MMTATCFGSSETEDGMAFSWKVSVGRKSARDEFYTNRGFDISLFP